MPRFPLPSLRTFRHLVGAWIVLAASLPSSHPLRSAEPEPPAVAEIVARVGDEEISRAELNAAVHRLLELQGRPPETAHSPPLEAFALEQLIGQRLVRAEIERSQIVVDDADVEARIIMMRAQLAPRPEALQAFQSAFARDPAALSKQLKLDIALEKMLSTQLTPEIRQQVFAQHHREFDGTSRRVSHIVLRPVAGGGIDSQPALEQQALAIRARILAGELSFTAAAEKYSAGPSRHRGGDIGFIPRHSALDDEFSRVAFALATETISPPFLTAAGMHLVTVTEERPGSIPLQQIRPQLERIVAQELLRQRVVGARQTTPVSYSPGVPHFESTPPESPGSPRRVVVDPSPIAAPHGAE